MMMTEVPLKDNNKIYFSWISINVLSSSSSLAAPIELLFAVSLLVPTPYDSEFWSQPAVAANIAVAEPNIVFRKCGNVRQEN